MRWHRRYIYLFVLIVAGAVGGWFLFRAPPRNTASQRPRPVYVGSSADGKQVLFRIEQGAFPRAFRYRLTSMTVHSKNDLVKEQLSEDRRVRNLEPGETFAVTPPTDAICWFLEVDIFENGTLASRLWTGVTGLEPGTRMTPGPTPTMKSLLPATKADNCFQSATGKPL